MDIPGELLIERFDGGSDCISSARTSTVAFLEELTRRRPPEFSGSPDDVLIVVNELVTNSFCYAPGSFTLTLRDMGEAVHVVLRDSSHILPRPRRVNPATGAGVGWYVISSLALDMRAVPESDGKSVHVFLAW